MSPHLPFRPEDVAGQAIGVAEAGAAILHLHARDPATSRPSAAEEHFMAFHGLDELRALPVATVHCALSALADDLGDTHAATPDALVAACFEPIGVAFARLAEAAGGVEGVAPASPAFSTTIGGAGVYVSDLWVARPRRGSGLGRKLLQEAARHDGERWGARFVKLAVYSDNAAAAAFYERADVLTISIHADPVRFYPFFRGHAQERGSGAGRGANRNLPLARGTDDAGNIEALGTALRRVAAFGAGAMVVALGLDVHVDDPFEVLAVSTDGFSRIGAAIAGTGLPLALVQEGGYVSDALGANLTSFLSGFSGARG
jgi:ribosomal protein S18 acetylase RimI-like enzyme